MSFKLSHSSKNKWLSCGHSYKLHYIDKLRPVTLSSALVFGSAIDNALNELLTNRDIKTAKLEFNKHWEQGENSLRELVDMPLNPNLEYSKYDLESDLLTKANWKDLFKRDSKFFDTKNKIEALLRPEKDPQTGVKPPAKDWLDIPEEDRMVLNYANWLSMQKKGEMLLQAYHDQILPHIAEVLAVQMAVELDDGNGNILNGIIDAVVRLQDGRVCILDNKTTSTEYEEDSVRSSEQLATYKAILNIFAEDPNHPWEHKIDCCGYAVLSKKLINNTTKVCKICGNVATGKHKTCDSHALGTRCGGEWDKQVSFKVKTQFIIGEISDAYAESVLENATTVKSCIEQGLFPKNYSACDNMFGRKCVYFNKCHGNKMDGLVQLEKKENG